MRAIDSQSICLKIQLCATLLTACFEQATSLLLYINELAINQRKNNSIDGREVKIYKSHGNKLLFLAGTIPLPLVLE